MAEPFTRDDLLSQIVAHWGPFSRQAETIRAMQDEIERLRAAGDALVAAIRNHDLTEGHIKAWKEARRG